MNDDIERRFRFDHLVESSRGSDIGDDPEIEMGFVGREIGGNLFGFGFRANDGADGVALSEEVVEDP